MSEEKPIEKSHVIPVKIEDEMRGAYLDYAMSVIIGRALPDVRDGLKPVHRRVLYAMYDLGNFHNKPYRKSARVVGDVIGKYHPHGDTAVYDTLVRMAQSFSLRYPLIDGQGNFGSVDGDAPAAMRYTEARMTKITDELMADLEKETVNYGPNYDDSLKEPLVFPAKFPNLLVNGSSGIAVGMATNIPPHNLTEVINATVRVIDNPETTIEELLSVVTGPDFPTAGFIVGTSGIRQAYRTGRGVITLRAKAEIEKWKQDRERIIITELPYQVNKAKLIEKIADLVKDKRIEGISDLRDESDRTGMRVVIEIKKSENSNVLLNQLYSLTQLQESYGISLLAIHQNQPKVFNLKEIIVCFIDHRKEVVTRRTLFELKKAEARAHILEGLKKAVENIDAVIQLIKGAASPDAAQTQLMAKFDFSEKQANAILEMRLQRLTGLERDKIIQDYTAVMALIGELKRILADDKLILAIIKEELLETLADFGDARRTEILQTESSDFDVEDLISDEECLVTITHQGYIKRTDPDQFRSQKRGGKGIKAVTTAEDDFVTDIFSTSTHSYLLCFTNRGRLYWLKVFRTPESSRVAKGKAIVNLVSLAAGEQVRAILPVKEFKENEFVVMVTKNGTIKKTALSEFSNVRNSGIIAMSIEEGDDLLSARITNGKGDIFLSTKEGKSIRFDETNVRAMGRSAYGVTGMDIDDSDELVSLEILSKTEAPDAAGNPAVTNHEILTVTELGYGKRTQVSEYRVQSRAGKGIITMKTTDKNGYVISARQVSTKDDLMLISDKGQMIRINIATISEQGRNTQGVRLMNLSTGEKVVAVEPIAESKDGPETKDEDAPSDGA